jgi:TonB family protein
VSSRPIQHWLTGSPLLTGSLLAFLVSVGTVAFSPLAAQTQSAPAHEELTRKTKTKVAPVYPDVARRMSITGTVKVLVVVAPNGNLKSTKVVGGHPLLVNAAMDAIKRWKFEPAPEESTGIVEFKFQPQD